MSLENGANDTEIRIVVIPIIIPNLGAKKILDEEIRYFDNLLPTGAVIA